MSDPVTALAIGVFNLFVLFVIFASPIYLKSKFEAAGKLGAEKALKDHQKALDAELKRQQYMLDADLERHRNTLAQLSDQVRSDLQKSVADDAIYVAKRHDKINEMYLRMSNAHSELLRTASECADNVDDARHNESRAHATVIAMRAATIEAALYLSEDVILRANQVINAIDEYELASAKAAKEERLTWKGDQIKWWARAHHFMTELQIACRSELQRSRPSFAAQTEFEGSD